jgi:lipopolysaccharide export system permease protein
MLGNLIPEYLSLGIPIGLTLGILLAFRKLAQSSELDVMRAVGLSYGRLLRVPYLFALVLAAVNLAIVGFIQPYSRYAYEGLRFELQSGALGASIKIGEFTNLGNRLTLRIDRSFDEGRRLEGIFIRAEGKTGQSISATAKGGQFMATDDPNMIILRLTDGVLIHDSPKFGTPRVLTFSQHDQPIPLPKVESFRGRGDADRELTLPELLRVSGDPQEPAKIRQESWANFHFRLVEVVAMFLLPLLAVALAVPPKRSSSALGVFLSIIILVTQHKVNEYGDAAASRGDVNAILALWGPFALFAMLTGWMYYQLAHVPGGQPIGALEKYFSKIGGAVRRWFARRTTVQIDGVQIDGPATAQAGS